MDRQRSFSLKQAGFIGFIFAGFSSLIFLFSLLFIKHSIVNEQETNFSFRFFSSHADSSSLDLNQTILLRVDSLEQESFSKQAKIELTTNFKSKETAIQSPHSGRRTRNVTDKSKQNVVVSERKERCDITKGKWILDETYPLYTKSTCPFIDEAFDCKSNGRLNLDFMKWRWQPHHCHLPRFNATAMLDMIRGKRLVFVGDSINRNQWESLLCLLIGAVGDYKVYETRGRRITKEKGNYSFRFVDYRCTVEYYVTHFLVHESKTRMGRKRVQTLQIDTMDRGTSRWKGADILVFNTAHWWSHYKTESGNNYYQEGSLLHPHLDMLTAFRRAMMTWASWVDKNINPKKTLIFFRSSSPSHFRGGPWNSGGHCKEATQPDQNKNLAYPEKNAIVEEVIKQMKTPVMVLNITVLSEYRIDGHPSIYGAKSRDLHRRIEDCSHWCLPGVPDTWNQLLYFHLQSLQKHLYNNLN